MPNNSPVRVETLSELQIWIKGEFALIAQTQETSNKDMTNVRRTVHELANQMTVILALNLPEKLATLAATDALHQKSIDQFTLDAAGRRSSLATLRFVYTMFGGAIATAIAFSVQLYKLVQH